MAKEIVKRHPLVKYGPKTLLYGGLAIGTAYLLTETSACDKIRPVVNPQVKLPLSDISLGGAPSSNIPSERNLQLSPAPIINSPTREPSPTGTPAPTGTPKPTERMLTLDECYDIVDEATNGAFKLRSNSYNTISVNDCTKMVDGIKGGTNNLNGQADKAKATASAAQTAAATASADAASSRSRLAANEAEKNGDNKIASFQATAVTNERATATAYVATATVKDGQLAEVRATATAGAKENDSNKAKLAETQSQLETAQRQVKLDELTIKDKDGVINSKELTISDARNRLEICTVESGNKDKWIAYWEGVAQTFKTAWEKVNEILGSKVLTDAEKKEQQTQTGLINIVIGSTPDNP